MYADVSARRCVCVCARVSARTGVVEQLLAKYDLASTIMFKPSLKKELSLMHTSVWGLGVLMEDLWFSNQRLNSKCSPTSSAKSGPLAWKASVLSTEVNNWP